MVGSVRHYKKHRGKYVPDRLKLIIVAESPPDSGLYFYDETGKASEPLFKEITRYFLGKEFPGKAEGLRAFADAGYLLVDATYTPVNNRKDRDDVILQDYPKLRADLKQIMADRPIPVVLIKANVCEILEPLLVDDGFNVLNKGQRVYFPSTG